MAHNAKALGQIRRIGVREIGKRVNAALVEHPDNGGTGASQLQEIAVQFDGFRTMSGTRILRLLWLRFFSLIFRRDRVRMLFGLFLALRKLAGIVWHGRVIRILRLLGIN